MKKILARFSGIAATMIGIVMPVVTQALTVKNYSGTLGIGSTDPETIVINIVNWVLGLLALIAVILVLIGGFLWMTAAGNEDKIEKAKKLLTAAVIGLVIILAAWGISIYAINIIGDATGTDTTFD